MPREIDGYEFDWFAIDISGQIGMFSTAGSGPIPQIIRDDFDWCDQIGSLILSPNFGNPHVWDDYARAGLWVYDWGYYQSDGPYKLEAKPLGDLALNISAAISKVIAIPRLKFSFSDNKLVTFEMICA